MATTASYTAQNTLVTDPAGVQRTNTVDGLGRLITVVENGISATTNYSYDVLGNLTGVTPAGFSTNCATPQGVNANRVFFYDSLGRLGTACNPESGTTTYGYDYNSNLTGRTDGRGKTATTTYDAFNRPLSKTYNDATPSVSYAYVAGQDFLSSVASGGASYVWSNYDALGRPGAGVQTVTGQGSWTFPSVVWTPTGQIGSIIYPSGRTVTTSFDLAGRPAGVAGALNGAATTYASVPTTPLSAYAANGALSQVTLGTNLTQTFGYNAQLQMTSVIAANGSGTQLMNLGFGYSGTQNNGNLQNQTITRKSPAFSATQNYGYAEGVSGVNRLTAASEGSNWSQTYSYDHVGNRGVTASSNVLAASFTPTPGSFNSNNQWAPAGGISAGYDLAGNMTSIAIASPAVTESMAFDAESRMTSWTDSSTGASVALTYDGEGRRATKTSSVYGTTVYVYDPAGNLAAEYGGAAPSVSGTLYLTQDHLGSTRLVTNASAGVVGCHDYFPFGEEIPATWGSRPSCYGQVDTTVKFTGQERDTDTAADLTGFDNFQARMMAGSQGRFLSPDPGNAGADPTNPQSWNMYGYVGNNPLALIDPSGLNPCVNGVNPDTGNLCATCTASPPPDAPPDLGPFFYNPCSWWGCIGSTIQALFFAPPAKITQAPQAPASGGACGPDGYRDATSQEQAKVLSVARANVGGRYRNGAGGSSSPQSGFDCSGFVSYCIRQAGIPYNYSSTSSMASNPALGPATGGAQSGDVVLFPGHAGFNDPGQSTVGSLLNAQSTAAGVRYSPPSWFGKGQTLRIRVKCK